MPRQAKPTVAVNANSTDHCVARMLGLQPVPILDQSSHQYDLVCLTVSFLQLWPSYWTGSLGIGDDQYFFHHDL
jgi:hypothetical protein